MLEIFLYFLFAANALILNGQIVVKAPTSKPPKYYNAILPFSAHKLDHSTSNDFKLKEWYKKHCLNPKIFKRGGAEDLCNQVMDNLGIPHIVGEIVGTTNVAREIDIGVDIYNYFMTPTHHTGRTAPFPPADPPTPEPPKERPASPPHEHQDKGPTPKFEPNHQQAPQHPHQAGTYRWRIDGHGNKIAGSEWFEPINQQAPQHPHQAGTYRWRIDGHGNKIAGSEWFEPNHQQAPQHPHQAGTYRWRIDGHGNKIAGSEWFEPNHQQAPQHPHQAGTYRWRIDGHGNKIAGSEWFEPINQQAPQHPHQAGTYRWRIDGHGNKIAGSEWFEPNHQQAPQHPHQAGTYRWRIDGHGNKIAGSEWFEPINQQAPQHPQQPVTDSPHVAPMVGFAPMVVPAIVPAPIAVKGAETVAGAASSVITEVTKSVVEEAKSVVEEAGALPPMVVPAIVPAPIAVKGAETVAGAASSVMTEVTKSVVEEAVALAPMVVPAIVSAPIAVEGAETVAGAASSVITEVTKSVVEEAIEKGVSNIHPIYNDIDKLFMADDDASKIFRSLDNDLDPLEKFRIIGNMEHAAQSLKDLHETMGKLPHNTVFSEVYDKDGNIGQGMNAKARAYEALKDDPAFKEMGRNKQDKALKNYEDPLQSILEETQPGKEQIEPWQLKDCAEHHATTEIGKAEYKEMYSVKSLKDGSIQAVQRCDNCKQYDLGKVYTDQVHGQNIPTGTEGPKVGELNSRLKEFLDQSDPIQHDKVYLVETYNKDGELIRVFQELHDGTQVTYQALDVSPEGFLSFTTEISAAAAGISGIVAGIAFNDKSSSEDGKTKIQGEKEISKTLDKAHSDTSTPEKTFDHATDTVRKATTNDNQNHNPAAIESNMMSGHNDQENHRQVSHFNLIKGSDGSLKTVENIDNSQRFNLKNVWKDYESNSELAINSQTDLNKNHPQGGKLNHFENTDNIVHEKVILIKEFDKYGKLHSIQMHIHDGGHSVTSTMQKTDEMSKLSVQHPINPEDVVIQNHGESDSSKTSHPDSSYSFTGNGQKEDLNSHKDHQGVTDSSTTPHKDSSYSFTGNGKKEDLNSHKDHQGVTDSSTTSHQDSSYSFTGNGQKEDLNSHQDHQGVTDSSTTPHKDSSYSFTGNGKKEDLNSHKDHQGVTDSSTTSHQDSSYSFTGNGQKEDLNSHQDHQGVTDSSKTSHPDSSYSFTGNGQKEDLNSHQDHQGVTDSSKTSHPDSSYSFTGNGQKEDLNSHQDHQEVTDSSKTSHPDSSYSFTGNGQKEDLNSHQDHQGVTDTVKQDENGNQSPIDHHGLKFSHIDIHNPDISEMATDLVHGSNPESSLLGIFVNDMILRFQFLTLKEKIAVSVGIMAICPVLIGTFGAHAVAGYATSVFFGKLLSNGINSFAPKQVAKLLSYVLPFFYGNLDDFAQIAANLGLSKALFVAYRRVFPDPRVKHATGSLPPAPPRSNNAEDKKNINSSGKSDNKAGGSSSPKIGILPTKRNFKRTDLEIINQKTRTQKEI